MHVQHEVIPQCAHGCIIELAKKITLANKATDIDMDAGKTDTNADPCMCFRNNECVIDRKGEKITRRQSGKLVKTHCAMSHLGELICVNKCRVCGQQDQVCRVLEYRVMFVHVRYFQCCFIIVFPMIFCVSRRFCFCLSMLLRFQELLFSNLVAVLVSHDAHYKTVGESVHEATNQSLTHSLNQPSRVSCVGSLPRFGAVASLV